MFEMRRQNTIKSSSKILLVLMLALLVAITSGQTDRGVGVRVKNKQNGKTQDVNLYKGSYALVIGVSNYTAGWDNLPGVSDDTKAVKSALEKQGFEVRLVSSPKKAEITAAFQQFIDDYGFEFENRLLIYFAGHGHTDTLTDGRSVGYIVPSDAPLPSVDKLGFERKAVDMRTIEAYAEQIRAKHALFVFDSCFSGKLVSRGEVAVPPYISEELTKPVRQFITAGAANQTVPDESIFRKLFVRGINGEADEDKDGYILGSELARYLKREVTNYTKRAETPQYGKILNLDLNQGDFVFVLSSKNSVASNAIAVSDSSAVEKEFWESIKTSTDAEDFKLYKEKYPNGIFVNLADLKIKQLTNSAQNNKLPSNNTQPTNSNSAGSNPKWATVSALARSLLKYDTIFPFSEGLAVVMTAEYPNGKSGFIDETGKEVIPAIYAWASNFSEGLASVQIGYGDEKKRGYIDKTGAVVIPLKYDDGADFHDGLAPVKIDNKYGFIDKSGTEIIPFKFGIAWSFSEGLAAVYLDRKCGFIDKTGTVVIPYKYELAFGFNGDEAVVELNGKFGVIDKTGRELFPFKYEMMTSLIKNVRYAKLNGKWGVIDKTGAVVIPFRYDAVGNFSEGGFMAKLSGKWGIIDKRGTEVTQFKYDDYEYNSTSWCYALQEEGFFGVKLNGKKGFVDIYGNEYFDF